MVALAINSYNTAEQPPAAPRATLHAVDREEHAATHCPLCGGSLWQRIRGLWCEPCKGWLAEEHRDGRLVFVLWQGRL